MILYLWNDRWESLPFKTKDVPQGLMASATLAHEIGHTFGALHDETYGDCKCPMASCLMETYIQLEGSRIFINFKQMSPNNSGKQPKWLRVGYW